MPIVVDRTLAAFAVVAAVYSPNGDQRLDQLRFTFVLAAPAHVKLIASKAARCSTGDLGTGPQELRWDGRLSDGKHAAVLEATGPFGARGQTRAVRRRHEEAGLPAALEGAAPLHRERAGDRDRTVGGTRVRAVVGPGRFSPVRRCGRSDAVTACGRGRQPHADSSAVSRSPTRRSSRSSWSSSEASSSRSLARGPSRARARSPAAARLGQLLAVWCTLIPIPRTTRPSRASARIPATLRPSTSTSFGRLTVGTTSATSASAVGARPARDERQLGETRGSTRGRSTTETRTLAPGGATHVAAEPAAARGLLVGGGDRALGASAASRRWVDSQRST